MKNLAVLLHSVWANGYMEKTASSNETKPTVWNYLSLIIFFISSVPYLYPDTVKHIYSRYPITLFPSMVQSNKLNNWFKCIATFIDISLALTISCSTQYLLWIHTNHTSLFSWCMLSIFRLFKTDHWWRQNQCWLAERSMIAIFSAFTHLKQPV